MYSETSEKRFLSGEGIYLADIQVEGAVSAVFVRNPFAHGRLLSIDTRNAAVFPGVVAVWTAEDLALGDIPGNLRTADVPAAMRRAPLVRDVARYAGEPVAVVLAGDPETAADAAELVFVDMDPMTAVVDARDARRDGTVIFPEAGTNVALSKRTRSGEIPTDAPISVELDLFHPRLAPTPLEPFGVLAVPDGDSLTFWCAHQNPHRLRRELAACLDIEESRIRVRVPDVGGAFGQKGQLNAEYVVVAAAALKMGLPVRWIQSRRENLTTAPHGRGSRTRVKMQGDADGRIRGLEVDILADAGAYPHSSAFVPLSTHLMAPGPYRVEALDVTTTIVTTTTMPTGPYRGAGRPEAAYGLERCIDAFARRTGLDPADVRRINLVRATDMPFTTMTGAVYDSGDYAQALDLLLETMRYDERRTEQRERRARRDAPMGIGLSFFLDRTGGSSLGIGEYGATEVTPDGRVVVRTGSTDSGQGHWPIWRRLAAEAMNMTPDLVDVVSGDTAEVAQGTGTFGSRSSQAGASSVSRTALEVRRQTLELAAELLEIDASDLRPDGRGGFDVQGDPTSTVTLARLWTAARERGTTLFAEEYFVPGAQTFPYAAHAAVVTVDIDTGDVDIEEYVAVDDCGRILDHRVVEGQVHGSVAQGIGQALYEVFRYDEFGQPITGSMAAYSLPHAVDIPPITTAHTETPSPTNPLGTKGVGESGTVGAPAAVINAIIDALSPWGVTDIPFPASPANVWHALQRANGSPV